MGIASLVLGIIAFVFAITFILAPIGVILAVTGLILGIVDTVRKDKTKNKKTISITGLILSAVMFVVLVIESIMILGIGILAYDVANNYDTNTIRDSIENAAVETFNSIYSSYEGSTNGSRVKTLLSNISKNNGINEHQIDVYYEGKSEEPYMVRQKVDSTKRYVVNFYKDLDGYINRVYIRSEVSTQNSLKNSNTI